jgi:hypothetical protein
VSAYVIYCRCLSALRLPRGDAIRIENPDALLPWVEIRNRYLDPPAQDIAYDLLVEVRVQAQSLEAAVNEGLQAAHSQLLGLTVAANAFVANPVLVAAYEIDPGAAEREWIQRYQPPEHPIPPNTREITSAAAGEFMRAAEYHTHRSRFGRVLAFYREALRYAEKDSALLAVEYQHITAETLTPVLRDVLQDEMRLSNEQLHAHFGVDIAAPDAKRALLSRIRLQEIYGGDSDLRRQVERVSNGFEHGFEDLKAAKDVAEDVVGNAGRLVRNAILRAARLPPATLSHLNSDRFIVPMPLFSTEYFYIGKLRVDDETLLAPGAEPIQGLRDWSTWVESGDRFSDGSLLVTTSSSARSPHEGLSIDLKSAMQRLPVGLPAGARAPQHRLKTIRVLDKDDGP